MTLEQTEAAIEEAWGAHVMALVEGGSAGEGRAHAGQSVMPRNRMTARDRNALAKLVARYGLAIVAQEADGLHSARRRPGRPTDRHWLPRAFIRWGLVQGKLLNDPKLNPSAAAEAINGRDSSSTLRKAYVKFERLRQLHPELKERSDKMLRFALRMEALEERLKPLGLYREEVINALWDENVTEEEWLALCHRFAPK